MQRIGQPHQPPINRARCGVPSGNQRRPRMRVAQMQRRGCPYSTKSSSVSTGIKGSLQLLRCVRRGLGGDGRLGHKTQTWPVHGEVFATTPAKLALCWSKPALCAPVLRATGHTTRHMGAQIIRFWTRTRIAGLCRGSQTIGVGVPKFRCFVGASRTVHQHALVGQRQLLQHDVGNHRRGRWVVVQLDHGAVVKVGFKRSTYFDAVPSGAGWAKPNSSRVAPGNFVRYLRRKSPNQVR